MTLPTTGDEKRLKRLASLLANIYEACPRNISPRNFVEACLAAASVVGKGPEQHKTKEIEKELSPSTQREVALTKIEKADGIFVSKLEHYQDGSGRFRSKTPRFETGDAPVEATELCERLGIGFDEAADAVHEARQEGPPDSTPLPQDEVFEPRLTKKLASRSRDVTPAAPTDEADRRRHPEASPEGARPEDPRDDAGNDPEDTPDTKGRDNTTSETVPNRPSERSDRNFEADVSRAYKGSQEANLSAFKARGTRAQRRFLDARVRGQSERLLFLDLINAVRVGMYTSGEDDEWSVKPAEHLRKDMGAPRRTRTVWEGSELIECKDGGFYDPDRGLCREMRVYGQIVEKWAELSDKGPQRWWLHTPEPERTSQRGKLSSDLQDENGHNHPELIDKALRILDDAEHRIDLDAVDEAIERLERKGGDEARKQLAHLRLKRETIRRQAGGEEGVVDIQNAYTPDDSGGRITYKKGGPQGILKAVKARGYDLEGVTNWDIKSCHTAALKQLADELEELGVDIDTSPLDEYPGKDKVVEDTGLPRGLVKTVEHAVKNSAFLPASLDYAENVEREIPGSLSIADAARNADVDTDDALQTLHDVFVDYRGVALEIARELLTTYWDEYKQPGGRGKPWCMKNHCGVPFYRDEHAEDDDPSSWCHNARTAVMAWALRGLEAAFCHSLTILSEEYDYEVAANEHDGLIVNGRLPDEDESDAIERAREMSGFHRAEIVEKPFADEDDIREIYGEGGDQEEPEEASAEAQEPANDRPRRHPGTRRRRRRQREDEENDEKTTAERAAEEAQRDLSDFHRRGGTRDRRGLPTAG